MTDFVGREDLVDDLARSLRRGDHLVLVGPRRIGKSTLLTWMEANPSPGPPQVHLLRVTVEGQRDVAGARRAIRARLEDVAPSAAADAAARRVRVVGAGVELADADADPWSTLADDLEDYRRGLGGEAVLAVALDEVPWWLEELERTAPGAARAALASLRALRDSGRWSHLRWIFTGSVGIAGRASSWGASAELNDLQVQVVPPLDRAAARHLLRLKTDNPHLSDDVCDAVSHLADRRPHWIEVIGARLPQGGRAVAREDVERASEALLTRHMRNQFDDEGNGHFHRRYTSDERSVVRAIFDVLSERGQVSPENGVVAAAMRASGQPPGSVRATISRLCDDFYLTEEGAGVRLSLPLFARWWTRWGEL